MPPNAKDRNRVRLRIRRREEKRNATWRTIVSVSVRRVVPPPRINYNQTKLQFSDLLWGQRAACCLIRESSLSKLAVWPRVENVCSNLREADAKNCTKSASLPFIRFASTPLRKSERFLDPFQKMVSLLIRSQLWGRRYLFVMSG